MRVFWALVAILLLGGAVAAFLNRPKPTTNPLARDAGIYYESDLTPGSATPTQQQLPPPPPVDFDKDLTNAINDAIGGGTEHAAKTTDTAPEGVPVELPVTEAFPVAKMIPCKAVKVGDELVIDGKYHIKGAGTKESPYVVPFELLMSAADVYDPRKGLSKMPQRVAFLSDRWVSLTGYVAFPISSTDPKEMLSMFNQWDGCCIGVPPTAYDAVETKLDKPVKGDDKFITFGTVTGVFKVDPYVDNGWLLGLYMMEHATLTNGKSEPVSPKQAPEN